MSKPPLNLLVLNGYSIFEQLQLEEALLRTHHENWCLVNQGSPLAIVMGISGKPDQLINLPLLRQKPVAVIQRFSGGGTVIVDPDTLFVTFICNAKQVDVACCPDKVLNWTAQFYQTVFPPGFQLRENDYAIGERKFGGNAQYFRKDRWLHHSSLLWNFQAANMDYLLQPLKMPKYRENRTHLDFLSPLQAYFPQKEQLFEKLFLKLDDQFTVKKTSIEQVLEFNCVSHRKSTKFVEI